MVLDWSLFCTSLPIPLQALSPSPPKDSKFNCCFSSSLLRFQPETPLFLPQNTAHGLFHTCPLSSSFFTPQLGQVLKSIITPFSFLNSPKDPSQLECPPSRRWVSHLFERCRPYGRGFAETRKGWEPRAAAGSPPPHGPRKPREMAQDACLRMTWPQGQVSHSPPAPKRGWTPWPWT